jgi:sugar phosphate isomerase/epimerase
MYKVGINFDEISDNLETAIKVMKDCDTLSGELRTVNGKNFVFWTDDEIATFKESTDAAGIELIAAATPLFKWYINSDDPEIMHDSFGFNPRLTDDEKRQIIKRTFEVASTIGIPRLRIFSGLGSIEDSGRLFAQDPLLAFMLELADKNDIDIYIENEPVCRVHTKQQIIDLLAAEQNPRLKLWLDIANLLELGEEIDDNFLAQIASRLGYVHVKDFVMKDGKKSYVPVGEGQIEYARILASIDGLQLQDLIFTVETHAKEDKVGASIKSLTATRKLVGQLSA